MEKDDRVATAGLDDGADLHPRYFHPLDPKAGRLRPRPVRVQGGLDDLDGGQAMRPLAWRM
jgi:hypothetical protein